MLQKRYKNKGNQRIEILYQKIKGTLAKNKVGGSIICFYFYKVIDLIHSIQLKNMEKLLKFTIRTTLFCLIALLVVGSCKKEVKTDITKKKPGKQFDYTADFFMSQAVVTS